MLYDFYLKDKLDGNNLPEGWELVSVNQYYPATGFYLAFGWTSEFDFNNNKPDFLGMYWVSPMDSRHVYLGGPGGPQVGDGEPGKNLIGVWRRFDTANVPKHELRRTLAPVKK